MGVSGMTEKGNADRASKAWHPAIRLILENPISALNMAAILFGGGIVYAQIGSYMRENDARVTRIEVQMRDAATASSIKEDRAALKTDGIARELNEVKLTLRGVESAVQFLVQQEQRRRPGP
jgi:hypothetical protein